MKHERRATERTPFSKERWEIIVRGLMDAGAVYREQFSIGGRAGELRKIAAEMCKKIGELEDADCPDKKEKWQMAKHLRFECDDHSYHSYKNRTTEDPVGKGWYFAIPGLDNSVTVWKPRPNDVPDDDTKHFCSFECYCQWAEKQLNPPEEEKEDGKTREIGSDGVPATLGAGDTAGADISGAVHGAAAQGTDAQACESIGQGQ